MVTFFNVPYRFFHSVGGMGREKKVYCKMRLEEQVTKLSIHELCANVM
jgi:hypothetical protein